MLFKIAFFLTLLCCINISYSQTINTGDTLLAHKYYQIGDSLLQVVGDYKASISSFKKAASIYEKSGLKTKYLNCLNKLAEDYRRLDQYDSAYAVAELILSLSREDSDEAAEAYERLGGIEADKYNLDKALNFHNKALEIRQKKPQVNAQDLIDSYSGIASVYLKKGHYQLAERYYLKAIERYKQSPLEKNVGLFKLYYNCARVYRRCREHNLALEYDLKALAIMKKNLSPNHIYIAHSYNSIGINYQDIEQYNKALEYFNKASSIYKKSKGNNASVSLAIYNIANVYRIKKQYRTAIKTCLSAIKIVHEDPLIYSKQMLSSCYLLLGRVYTALSDYELSLEYFRKSLHLNKEIFDSKHPQLEHVYAETALVHSKRGEYKLALHFFQKALIANVLDFNDSLIYTNPSLNNYMDADGLSGTLRDKGITFYHLYGKSGELKDLKGALQTFQLCDQLITKRLKSFVRQSDKAFLEQYARIVCHYAIKASLELFEITRNNEYQDLAFYFNQKSKAIVLLEAVNSKSGKNLNLLPDGLRQLENDLNVDISYFQSQRLQSITDKNRIDSVKISEYDEKLFTLNRQMDSLIQALERTYPQYYDIKYNYKTISLAQVKEYLKAHEALVEYFSTEEGNYVFAITQDTTIIKKLAVVTTGQIDSLQQSLRPEYFLHNQQKAFGIYTQVAHKLYQEQVAPILDNLVGIKKLYIVPNGNLHQIPFELLLAEKKTGIKGQHYKELPYLIKKYDISYAYSATLLFRERPPLPANSVKRKKDGVLAFAPIYSEQITDTVDLKILGKFRDAITPLKWNKTELQSINQYFDGEFLFSEMATEKEFNDQVNDYDIVHLAMHGLVDDEDPMNSKLVFSHASDSLNDGYLHSFELYNMNINTQLAVLSACNTGSGELHSGEGLMSLARAFQYAGCQSVVMSHWRVDDKSSSIIMGEFYKHLADGKNKDEALRLAKLNYLDNASPLTHHPFYWNSFVVMGDIKPIVQGYVGRIWYWGGGMGLLLLMVWAIATYRKKA